MKIAVVGTQTPIGAVALACQFSQTGIVQPGNDNGTAVVCHKSTRRIRNRRACRGADTQYRQPVPGLDQLADGSFERIGFAAVETIRNQQHTAVGNTGLLQQFLRQADCTAGVRTLCRHQRGGEDLQLADDGLCIGGQRTHHKRRGRIDDQRRFTFLLLVENIAQFQFCAFQAAGFDIGGVHRARQVEHQHQRRLLAEYRLRQFLPCRTGQRNNRQHTAEADSDQGPRALPGIFTDQQMHQQTRIDHALPAAADQAPAPHQPKQQDQGKQGEQPQGTQKVKCRNHFHGFISFAQSVARAIRPAIG